jgi:hypothetical protein
MPNTPVTTQQRSNEVSRPYFFAPLIAFFTLNNRLPNYEALKFSLFAPLIGLLAINSRFSASVLDYKASAPARAESMKRVEDMTVKTKNLAQKTRELTEETRELTKETREMNQELEQRIARSDRLLAQRPVF